MNKKCISKCSTNNENILDPLTLKTYKNNEKVCFTQPNFNKKTVINKKKCTSKNEANENEIMDLMINPILNFNSNLLLSIYEINNLDDLIEWSYSKFKIYTPLDTISRVINCYFKIHGINIKVDSRIYSLFYQLWFHKINPDIKYEKKQFFNILKKMFKKEVNEKTVKSDTFNLVNIFTIYLNKYYKEYK